MFSPRVKCGAFVLEGLNSISTIYYFYFVYWFTKSEFGFGSRENLLWALGHGAVYVVASVRGGRYGQRSGYLQALKVGFAGMAICFFLGWLSNLAGWSKGIEMPIQAGLMILATLSICYTWPSLEAMVSEGEAGHGLQRKIGIYNLIWSGAGALAYFTGGALIVALGARNLIFLIPALLIAGQYAVAEYLSRQPGAKTIPAPSAHGAIASEEERHRTKISPRTFLRMSWLANPCAYVAINSAVPLIPTLAEQLGLEPRAAGFFCSLWLFSRTATFLVLWRWNGWHYRFGWLASAFVALIAGFFFLFLSIAVPGLARGSALLIASLSQLVFGVGLGLIYYSSLFYSMDVGDTKGDHGGLHEAAIGVGLFGGPLVGAAAQFVRPGSTLAAASAISAVLVGGLVAMCAIRFREPAPRRP